jgi:hypothetical protein
MITLLLIVPIIGALLLIPIKENSEITWKDILFSYNLFILKQRVKSSRFGFLFFPFSLKSKEKGEVVLNWVSQADRQIKDQNQKMKNIALFTSLINLFISIFLWIQFDSNTVAFQFVSEFSDLSFCHFNMGIDGISLFFVLLTTFITPIALLSNYTNITTNLKYFLISFLILETLQIATFVSLDLLLFYVFFESV